MEPVNKAGLDGGGRRAETQRQVVDGGNEANLTLDRRPSKALRAPWGYRDEAERRTALGRWKMEIPYGWWECDDGREYLFNRHYIPLWMRVPGGHVTGADPNEFVAHIKQQHVFHDTPWGTFDGPTIRKINAVLLSWGLPSLPPRPRS